MGGVFLLCCRVEGIHSNILSEVKWSVTQTSSLTKEGMESDKDLKSVVVIREGFSTFSLYSCGIYIQLEVGIEDLFQLSCVSPLIFAEGFLFVFGGQDENKQTLSSGEKYDPDANSWTALPPMNEVKHCFFICSACFFFSFDTFVLHLSIRKNVATLLGPLA